jgi:cysteine desulfurase/selenocysteine lyase
MSEVPILVTSFPVDELRADFPCLKQTVRGHPLVYLDNAASAQVPQCVIDALVDFHSNYRSNIHRGVHALSQRATAAFDVVREKVATFLNAREAREIVFVSGATEAINLVAATFGRLQIKEGDRVLVSAMEHHSNIVPWQMLCEQVGASLDVVPVSESGDLDMECFAQLLGPRTRLVAIVHVSNALGTINPVEEIVIAAHAKGIPVLLDGAQAVPHGPVDVQALDCDFYCFSGHKLYGPTGVGVLYAKAEHLEAMPPYRGGGDMIRNVSFEGTTYNEIPHKFEAGTPNISGVIALGAALDYLDKLDWEAVRRYESELSEYAYQRLTTVPGLRLVGDAERRVGVFSFVMDGIHPHDIGTILDQSGVAIRTGHHCAEPLMHAMNVPATARASLAFYNTRGEVDALIDGLNQVCELFGVEDGLS